MWGKRTNKYGARKTKSGDRTYHSALEASVNGVLLLRERAGDIRILRRQDRVLLVVPSRYIFGKFETFDYRPDFKCEDTKTKEEFWVEAKGLDLPVWRMKKKLWKMVGPGRLEIWQGSAAKPFLAETIYPNGIDNV